MGIPNCVVTNKGLALLAKTPAGDPIPATRWQIGTGVLQEGQDEKDLTALISPLKYIPIASVQNTDNHCIVTGQFTNQGMVGFSFEELGLWATDPDEGEILYAVGEARGEGEAISGSNEMLDEFIFAMDLVFDGKTNVTVNINKSLIYATQEDLAGKADLVDGKVPAAQLDLSGKADLDPETGKVPAEQLDLSGKADLEDGKVPVSQLPAMGAWRRSFEVEQWDDEDGELRIPQTEHGLTPTAKYTMSMLRQRVQRTALDYYGDSAAAQGRTGIVNAMKSALEANETTPGTYPTATDGHVQLTWYQVQYYLLEGVLASDTEAQAKAEEKGFDWQDRDITGAVTEVTLDQVLTAAYIPALDGSSASLDALCTDVVLQGLRLRRKADNAGTVTKYDLDGQLVTGAWAVFEAQVYWDLDTADLVISGPDPFAGDVCVMV